MAQQRKKFVSRPDQVKVGHRTYRIQYLEDHEWQEAGEDEGQRGVTHHPSGLIRIRISYDGQRSADDMLRELLLHEFLHICNSNGMAWNAWENLKEADALDYSVVEEILVGAAAPQLLMVLKDNPEVLAYLLDDQEHE